MDAMSQVQICACTTDLHLANVHHLMLEKVKILLQASLHRLSDLFDPGIIILFMSSKKTEDLYEYEKIIREKIS